MEERIVGRDRNPLLKYFIPHTKSSASHIDLEVTEHIGKESY